MGRGEQGGVKKEAKVEKEKKKVVGWSVKNVGGGCHEQT